MYFLIHLTEQRFEQFDSAAALAAAPAAADELRLYGAGKLLERYVATAEGSAEMALLRQVRDRCIADLDAIDSAAEITGLMVWLMADHGIDYRGESLEETADRLGDLDIETDSDRYTDLIFHLKDAVERLDDIELDAQD